jgi:phage terminase large subunit-like protein
LSITEELRQRLEFGDHLSPAERLAYLTPAERADIIKSLDARELMALEHDWHFWARPSQIAPEGNCPCGCEGRWLNWLILAGRGWGKTRTGAEWVHENVNNGTYRLLHLVGATASDVRDIMVEGPSGILNTVKPENSVHYSPTKRLLEWGNGARALCFSADEPERFRGVQCEAAWADELAAWRYEESWKQLQLGLRVGKFPRTVITTTPRPTPLVKRLARAANWTYDREGNKIAPPRNHITKGTTYDNIGNLAEAFIQEITQEYEGTRFGRQEIYAEILEDNENALWTRELIELQRREPEPGQILPGDLKKVVIGVDPAMTFGEQSDETGIVVCGIDYGDKAWVIQDASGKYSAEGWARKVVELHAKWDDEYRPESCIVVAERNQGGDLVERNIVVEDSLVPVKLIQAKKSKVLRAEPVSTAYERDKVYHVGRFDKLEEQMCNYEAGSDISPDRLDALVYALTELVVKRHYLTAVNMGGNELATEKSYWKA